MSYNNLVSSTAQDSTPLQGDSWTIFEAGDRVVSRNPKYPFWMTVVSVNPVNQFILCNFGSTDRCAGNFRSFELDFFGGNEIAHSD